VAVRPWRSGAGAEPAGQCQPGQAEPADPEKFPPSNALAGAGGDGVA
jgi:hypothetical protein